MLVFSSTISLFVSVNSGFLFRFFFQAEDGIRDWSVTGVQTCALPISLARSCAKRNALADEIVRGFRREQRGIGRRGPQPLGAELGKLERSRRDRKHVPNLVVRGEKPFFVFLQIGRASCRERV